MKPAGQAKKNRVARYRQRLLLTMVLVVGGLTVLGLFLAQRKVAVEAERDLLQDFRNELALLHGVQEVRRTVLAERVRTLAQRPRIRAALEDNALDLLYPSARDELRDILAPYITGRPEGEEGPLEARFYRFLGRAGAVITPPPNATVGELSPEAERRLTLSAMPGEEQIGYLPRAGSTSRGAVVLDEILAVPIFSSDTGDVIAALVLGFKPIQLGRQRPNTELQSGILLGERLYFFSFAAATEKALAARLRAALGEAGGEEKALEVDIDGTPSLVFAKLLNPGSAYPPAYEVAIYPLTKALARQRQLRNHVLLAGGLLLLAGLLASFILSARLSEPVEELAVVSEENRRQRKRAEAALEMTSEELQRAARFSSDASHQLKTPVTVMRTGIEGLLARDDFSPQVYDELATLLHQTYRMSGMVDDLLLLSRMDAGRLQIQFEPVNLSQLLEEWIDDLSALPDDLQVELKTDFPPDLKVQGEKRYISLIMQNLLENARKYNRPGGEICVAAREEDGYVIVSVENTGKPIPPAARAHIFERFHRGAVGENVPGHGLGLNLARELARLHGGDLRLVRSDAEMTEFEVRLRTARQPALHTAQRA